MMSGTVPTPIEGSSSTAATAVAKDKGGAASQLSRVAELEAFMQKRRGEGSITENRYSATRTSTGIGIGTGNTAISSSSAALAADIRPLTLALQKATQERDALQSQFEALKASTNRQKEFPVAAS